MSGSDRQSARLMLDALPKYYDESKIVVNLMEQEGAEIDLLHGRIQDVLNQFFIDKATWGLDYWETVCGIPVNRNKPDDQRISVIKSKLRGAGTVTLATIKNVVDSFENGEISVQENFGNYEVIITFIGKRGVPPNLKDVEQAVREIMPAHLGILFKFTYLTWNELDAANLTWDALEALGMDWDHLEIWNPAERSV